MKLFLEISSQFRLLPRRNQIFWISKRLFSSLKPGQSLLHLASEFGHPSLVSFFLQQGFNIEIKEKNSFQLKWDIFKFSKDSIVLWYHKGASRYPEDLNSVRSDSPT
jgi:ankyrin repeat protein